MQVDAALFGGGEGGIQCRMCVGFGVVVVLDFWHVDTPWPISRNNISLGS